MASERKSGGDLVLESKHLAGLFLLLVVIFGVVFTLGYLLGRSQYDPKLRAAVAAPSDSGSQVAASSAKAKGTSRRRGKSARAKKFRLGFLSLRRAEGRGRSFAAFGQPAGLREIRDGVEIDGCAESPG